MTATFVRSGVYRVRGAGLDQIVIAEHGCDAIAAVIDQVLP